MRILGLYVLGIALTVGVPMLAAPRAQAGEVSTQAEDRSKETVVKGVVVDEGGQFVQDAVVTVKGSSKKAKTNAKGEFKIKAKNDDVLVFSAPVKESKEVTVKSMNKQKNVEMKWLKSDDDKVQIFVHQIPQFPFGDPKVWLAKNIRYPMAAQKEKREGKVFVQFIIEKDGSISNVRVLTKGSAPYADLQEESMRAVRMMPRWRPGIIQGRTVRVNYTIPINFSLRK